MRFSCLCVAIMESESNFSSIAPSIFDGDNYHMWAIRMETYLEAMDL